MTKFAALAASFLMMAVSGTMSLSVSAVQVIEDVPAEAELTAEEIVELDIDAIVSHKVAYNPPIDGDGRLRDNTFWGSFAYVLNNTYQQYEVALSAPSDSAAIYTFYTTPSQGYVTMYIKTSMTQYGSGIANHVFDFGSHSPSFSISVPQGTTYYLYLQASIAGTTGTVSYKKVTA